MATPFFVPLLSGALIKRQEISDEYDSTAGDIIDAASANYKSKLKGNEARIKLQDSNYAAVETAFGTTVAEAAAKYGLLEGVETSKVVNYVDASLKPGLKKELQGLNLAGDKKSFFYKDPKDPKTINQKQLFNSIFKEDITVASSKVDAQKDWASKNLNKGAISNVSKMFLGEQDKPKSFVEKTQNVLFGEKPDKAVFDAAAEKNLGETVTVQPSSSEQIASLEEIIGYKEPGIAGSILDQDRAISSILDIKNAKIGGDGGIIFPARFNKHVIAIKSVAPKYTEQFTNNKDKVDTTSVMLAAQQEVNSTAIQPIANAFTNYQIDGSAFAEAQTSRVMIASGMNEKFLETNGLTKKDFTVGKVPRGTGSSTSDIKDKITVSDNVVKLFEDKINTLESVEMQAVFIDYLPNNLSMTITKKDGTKIPVNVKDYYKTLFQLKTY